MKMMPSPQRKKVFTAEMKLLGKLESMGDMMNGGDWSPSDTAILPTPGNNGGAPAAGSDELRRAIGELKSELLADIKELMAENGGMTGGGTPDGESEAEAELRVLKTEIRALARSIQQTKDEIAALYKSKEQDNRLVVVKHELDSVVAATEDATADILEAVERIDQNAHNIRSAASDEYVQGLSEDVIDQVVKVFESCNFQDLTGQRINKVVNTLKFIEERVTNVLDIWGDDDLGDFDEAAEPKGLDDLDKTITQKVDNVERISQDEIDKLFD